MKLVVLLLYNGNDTEEHMFWTDKPISFFCSYDCEITESFTQLLKEKYPTIYKYLGEFPTAVHYYDEKTLDII